ncbi:MAG TPA: penicillin-binding transpeptidase domain-containing protein [Mycobacteriales bacterium]|nr:penicillin-binding transpeptidase domain-containing protein [Mycobacteriales bacterium]
MPDRSRLRLVVLGVLVVSLVATLLGRLWYLQVLDAPQLRIQAAQNHIRDIVTPAPRGLILDDTGQPLVDNKPALVVSVDRTALARLGKATTAKVLGRLAKQLSLSYKELDAETTPCSYKKVPTKKGKLVVVGVPTGCNNGVAYQPVVVSELKPTLAATRKALQIKEQPELYPGITVDLTAIRHYPMPYGALASAMLGYTSKISQKQLDALPRERQEIERNAIVGATGLEAQYERYLRGTPGVKQVSVDHVQAITGLLKNTQPVAGDAIVTNIDAKVQAALEGQLQSAINAARHSGFTADYAAGVVLNARTGGVVAMASDPTYQPNHAPPTLSTKQYNKLLHAPGHPLFDKAFEGVNPPGSTFKLISSSGLLHDGMMTTSGSYECPTFYQGHHNFDIEAGRGYIPLRTALIVSCDTFFFKLGANDWSRDERLISDHKKPIEGVQHMARDYGLGENPGLDLPAGEVATGHIGDRRNTKLQWKELRTAYCQGAKNPTFTAEHRRFDEAFCKSGYVFEQGDQENENIGQGYVTVSPLQLAVAYAAMANGGTVFEPRIAKAIVSPSGKLIKRIKAPVRDHLPLTKEQLDYLRSAFIGVTTSTNPPGTAVSTFQGFPMNKVTVGGKTGTAELSGTNQNGSWFVSFAGPVGEKPQFVTVIEVNKSDQGAVSAAPYVRAMWDRIYGFGGHPALFPNGVPPTKLPKIKLVEAGPKPHHHASTTPSTSSPSPGATGSPNASSTSTPTTSAMGLPPVLPAERRRTGLP